jgi:hypothetical protein
VADDPHDDRESLVYSGERQTEPAGTRSTPVRFALLATPLLFAVTLAFHPQTNPALSAEFLGQNGRWIGVHVVQLVLTVPLGFAVPWALEGLYGAAATVARLAMATFMVFFSAYDAVAGLATGILIRYGQGLTGDDRDAVAGAVDYLFTDDRIAAALRPWA